jgi:hypothetical protein
VSAAAGPVLARAATGRPRGPVVAAAAWLLLVASEALLVALAGTYERSAQGSGFGLFLDGLIVFATVAGSVGLFLRLRRPDNAVGAALLAGPLLIVDGFVAFAIASVRLQDGGASDALGGLAGAVAFAILIPGLVLTFVGVAILFPDGHLPGARWRNPVRLLALVGADTSGTMPRNPLAIPGLGPGIAAATDALGAVVLVSGMALATAAVATRFRGARGVERQQLKWFVTAVVLNAILLPVSFLTDIGPADVMDVASVLVATLIPIAIGIAILRYRLYDIDTIVNRALVYGSLTAVLAGVMSAGIALTKQLFESILGQGTDVTLIVSTVVVVSTFEPIKRRIQAIVDRRFKPGDDPSARVHRLEQHFRTFVGALDPVRSMREVLAISVESHRATAGTITWRLASRPSATLTIRSSAAAAGTRDEAGSSDSIGLRVAVTTPAAMATIELAGVAESETSREALSSLLRAVLEELSS